MRGIRGTDGNAGSAICPGLFGKKARPEFNFSQAAHVIIQITRTNSR
jgi:hypothetical protein